MHGLNEKHENYMISPFKATMYMKMTTCQAFQLTVNDDIFFPFLAFTDGIDKYCLFCCMILLYGPTVYA